MACFLAGQAFDSMAERLEMSSLMTIVAFNVLIRGETLISNKVSLVFAFFFKLKKILIHIINKISLEYLKFSNNLYVMTFYHFILVARILCLPIK